MPIPFSYLNQNLKITNHSSLKDSHVIARFAHINPAYLESKANIDEINNQRNLKTVIDKID